MVGNNSASVVADAWIKGLRGYDTDELWKAVTHGAHAVHPEVSSTGRLGWEYYDSLGYVPCDVGINENAARTLEYSYNDWCIYQFGKALGRGDEELIPYAKAALNYKNLYDPEYRLMIGKKADGAFERPFSNIEDSLAILDEESDEEMRELAKEELKDSKEQVEELEKELKILLLPKDPNDDKNVIVEIRAGAGGEEAALFAAEIYRMYVHYAENRGWKVETLDAISEAGIGRPPARASNERKRLQ